MRVMSRLNRVKLRLFGQILAWWGLISGGLPASPPLEAADRETLHFQGGGHIPGVNRGFRQGRLVWELTDGTELLIPLQSVQRVEYPAGGVFHIDADDAPFAEARPSPQPDDADASPLELPAGLHWLQPTYESTARFLEDLDDGFTLWTKRLEIGARLLDGNTNDDFVTAAGKFERTEKTWSGQLEFFGRYGRSNGQDTTNRWNANVTYDYGRHGKWIVFATAKNEYDQFENLDYRGTYSSGLGYRFVNEKRRRLIVRFGPAFTYEQFSNPVNVRTTPDGFSEVEMNWPLNGRSSLESKTTMNPSLRNFNIFRLISNNGVLFKLDHDGRWKLKLGFRVEYNSRPNDDRLPTDYTTNILLVYTRK